MSQERMVGPLDRSIGYTLKQAATAENVAMDSELRPLGLTVSQYSCLELLRQNPGTSNAELARGAFVTRQSMNEVLRGLQERGLVARADTVAQGRARPAELTPAGQSLVVEASRAVARVEQRMISSLSESDRGRLLGDLKSLIESLS
ncbi:MarR family winged helix-turn-helix transcriptional regulator [Amnibacterium flavum]|uniref:MarR family transcriptional regulator n=1 Tax=Amnibacterium flavum TaxID=2173173 RepID=A0A2V1HN56_9MICO|nr:MarR family transcriptional regulator [Amnibacterium flavum]PVZ93841.1 MarR family transcriptional regulator [Amnibacterium flavum]